MNSEQYYQWKLNTIQSMVSSGQYTVDEAKTIVDWFDGIRGSIERKYFGDTFVDAFSSVLAQRPFTDRAIYAAMTSRAWLYAEEILGRKQEQES